MRVAFLYNEASEDPAGQSDDPQCSPMVAALECGGHDVRRIACTLDLARVSRELEDFGPDIAFNRVDSLGGSDAMMAAVPLLLEALRLPYTGCPAAAVAATASKVAVKERLARAGLPTPAWVTADGCDCGLRIADCGLEDSNFNPQSGSRNPQFIIKSIYEHASFRMDDASVVGPMVASEVAAIVRRRESQTGRPFFAEVYVDGREFNLSLWGEGPDVLPVAEIVFSNFPVNKPRIVGQRAKWDEGSFEYCQTERRFDFPAADEPLLQRLRELATECWRLFGLRGYARIDVRVDAGGLPWILEVNCNPCLVPDVGFAAAWERAGVSYHEGIERILGLSRVESVRG